MATSYNCTIKIPTASTWLNGGYTVFNQLTSYANVGLADLSTILTDAANYIDSTYTATTTFTQLQIGSFIYVTFKVRDMQIDPAVSGDDLVAITLVDEFANLFTGCFEEITICNDCYNLNIDNCEDAFILTGLNATTNYKLVFTDNQSNVNYTYYAQSDVQGLINIDATYFPDGVFNPYSSYTVSIFDNNGNPMVLSLDAVEYDCYHLTFTPNTIVFD